MNRIELLAEKYARHIGAPWQRTVAGAQRVVVLVYDKELERSLRARMPAFEMATRQAGRTWQKIDLAPAFAEWIAEDEYREAYFSSPQDLRLKLDAEFPSYVADRIRATLAEPEVTEDTVVGIFGVGALFGFVRLSEVLKMVESDIQGRLLVFFPGQHEGSNYRLLDARDGWNYLAVPITAHGEGDYV